MMAALLSARDGSRVLLALLAVSTAVSANYVIFSQRFSADPAPIVHEGRVYLYTRYALLCDVLNAAHSDRARVVQEGGASLPAPLRGSSDALLCPAVPCCALLCPAVLCCPQPPHTHTQPRQGHGRRL